MRKITAIMSKELTQYFTSPIAYIMMVIILSVYNVFFFLILDHNQEASLRDLFAVMEFMMVFFIPLLTMRLIAEEKGLGTLEFICTTPTKLSSIVLGKYLGSLVFFSILVGLTSVYYLILELFSNPDRWTVLTGYCGIWLEGAFFIAVGLMTSSWTRNQVIAALCSYMILFSLYFCISLEPYISGNIRSIVGHVSVLNHLQNFSVGLISFGSVIYFLSGIILCLWLTGICINNRLWR